MPDWRAFLRLKKKQSPTSHPPQTTEQPAQSTPIRKPEPAPVASPSTNSTGNLQLSSHPSAPDRQTSTGKVSSSVTNGLKLALRLLKEAVTGIGVPGLEAAVSGVVKVIDIIENVRDNDKNIGGLSRRISSVAAAVTNSPNLHPKEEAPEALRLRMAAFLRELEVLLDEVEDILSDRNVALRAANSEANRDAITEINASIDQLISQFTAEGIISLELNVASARQDVRAVGRKVEVVDQKVDDAKQAHLLQVYEALIQSIPRAKARYNDKSTKPSRSCHRGTRTDLLRGINKWIDGGADDTPYLWLCGEVGVGKTTVAHTIAEEQDRQKQLGASFFFSRHDRDRQDPHLLFPSIAYQLARFDEGIWKALAEILKPDPDVVNRDLPEQLTKLILEPLSRSGIATSRTIVIAIDGLDECSDPASVLDALALGVKDVSVHLRVLVCSRPYAAIQAKFKNTHLYHLATQNHFHDINPETLSNDVATFLTWSLREIAARPGNHCLPSPWPADDELAELIDRASGLFIVGSTYTKYIDDPVEDNPAAQLKRILSRKRGIGSSPLAELDALYDQVLDDLRRTLKTAQDLEMARDIIESVILAQSDMSITASSGLLAIEPADARSILRRLTAVILLPEDDDKAITPFHASFGEYIQDETRCTIQGLSVDTTSAHDRIAARCITSVASAARDGVVGMETPIPFQLCYASLNLATHIFSSSHGNVGGDRERAMQCAIWTWLNLLFTFDPSLDKIKDAVERAGFKELVQAEGPNADAEPDLSESIGRLMVAKHALAINHTTSILFATPIPVTESAETRRSKGIQIIRFSTLKTGKSVARLEDVLSIVRDARYWNMLQHPDLFIEGVVIDPSSCAEVRLLVRSPTSLRGISRLSKYLERKRDLETMSKLRLALGIAKGVYHLHESSFLSYGWLAPDFILVSAEGNPIYAPRKWSVGEAAKSEGPSDVNSIDCQMLLLMHLGVTAGSHWFCPEIFGIQMLPEARRSVDVWDFGSLLYHIMTEVHPLLRYKQLADELSFKHEDYWDNPLKYKISKVQYEMAVSRVVDTIESFEEVKTILKSCWAYNPQDRPTIQVVVERLEAIIRSAGATL